MVCKKLAQHREITMQSSNMYLAAFQHTIYDNHVFVLLFLQSNSYYFTFYWRGTNREISEPIQYKAIY